MMNCLMISGGPLELDFCREFLSARPDYDLIIAVDAGLRALGELGIHPDLLVGDFDTYGMENLENYKKDPSCQFEIHQPEKDETDTDLAFRTAMERGCTSIDLLGATGGRLDHEISNIHLLLGAKRKGLNIHIYDQGNKICLLDADMDPETVFYKDQLYGTYVSFLPLTEEVKGITLTGFKYPLFKKDISILENPSLCVSNEVTEEKAVMTFDKGVLICVESRDQKRKHQ